MTSGYKINRNCSSERGHSGTAATQINPRVPFLQIGVDLVHADLDVVADSFESHLPVALPDRIKDAQVFLK